MTEETKWERIVRERHDRIVAQLKGRTVVEVANADADRFELIFDDGSSLEVNGYVDQRGCSDVAGLNYELWDPGTSTPT